MTVCGTCQTCISVCPYSIWEFDTKERQVKLNQSHSISCALDMSCVESCPTGAIEIIKTDL